jgi:hypothetical protein
MHDNLPTLNASPRAEATPVQITMDTKNAPRIRIAIIANLDLAFPVARRSYARR